MGRDWGRLGEITGEIRENGGDRESAQDSDEICAEIHRMSICPQILCGVQSGRAHTGHSARSVMQNFRTRALHYGKCVRILHY